MEVTWTEKAFNDYLQNIEYVLTRWTKYTAINFINEVDSIIELIKTKPEAFPSMAMSKSEGQLLENRSVFSIKS